MDKPTVFYLGHSAWVVETPGHFLLFDVQDHNVAEDGALTDGRVGTASVSGKPAYALFSHKHHDHYSGKLHEAFAAAVPPYFTLLGDFSSRDKPNTFTLRPREKREFADASGGITVHTADSTDAGVCWLVQADGINIFFAGDNADWADGDPNNKVYYREIDYIAGLGLNIDMAFIPVCTFFGQRPADMTRGAIYAVEKLKPALTFPMHGNGREYLYREFEGDLRKTGSTAKVVCAEGHG
ncbi:MAG: MBL fold metallo-hydrolase [Clostridiales bacterium]|jgi:L-ascorbate metabolism protein UlaG (beta-lactamase superfamily)|nr:MBL fold metallo-hydrolase [Clostridiales bacterium]